MATTSRRAAELVLAALDSAEISWALLHGADHVLADPRGDVDLALRKPNSAQIDLLFHNLEVRGLFPLIVWPYDVNSASLFVVTDDLAEGVQLDLLADPEGQGRYGFRTDVALADSVVGREVSSMSSTDSWLYQVRKRSLKRDRDCLETLLIAKPAADWLLRSRIRVLFSPLHANLMLAVIDGGNPASITSLRGAGLQRRLRRLSRPAGLWVHVVGMDASRVTESIAARVRPIVPHVATVRLRPRNALARLPAPGPCPGVRWRAGVVLSHGASPFGADLSLSSHSDLDSATRLFTAEASVRARRHFLSWLAHTTP